MVVRNPLVALAVALLAPHDAQALTDLAAAYGGCTPAGTTQTVSVDPSTYDAAVLAATPGTRIALVSGTYTNGLRVYDRNGSVGNCIVIEGPADRSAVLVGAPINGVRNVVQIRNSSYVVIRNLRIDGTNTTNVDAVKSDTGIQGAHASPWSHHVTLENLHIHDFAADQQIVGISTKATAWNWVVRRSLIERAGTGIYFGDSDGRQHFVNGLVELNVVRDTIGYNLQVKHQTGEARRTGAGFESLPATGRTVIRHNVFHKSGNSSTTPDDRRPNLLVGVFPLAGAGSDDDYVVAGNFFFENPSGGEPLFQGEGNVYFVANVLWSSTSPGVVLRENEGPVRRVRVFGNTVVVSGNGVSIANVDAAYTQLVRGNAVFAGGTALSGGAQADNVTDARANAGAYLVNPSGVVTGASNRMDLRPLAGALTGTAIDATPLAGIVDADRDFDDVARGGTMRGAYEGRTPGWQLAIAEKVVGAGDVVFGDGFE